jgi:hypothetical protein
MVPVYQIAPIESNAKAVMFNLHVEKARVRALDDMLYYKVPALTAVLQLVQDEKERPSSILFVPVFSRFQLPGEPSMPAVKGSISVVFSWDTVLAKNLPEYIKGLICVLESTAVVNGESQVYSFEVSGGDVLYLGKGDKHDSAYDHMKVTVETSLFQFDPSLPYKMDEILGNVVTFKFNLYPSKTLEKVYLTSNPMWYSIGVACVLLTTSLTFVLYDYLVTNNQNRLTRLALRSSSIVDSLFPAVVRKRLFGEEDEELPKTDAAANPSDRLRRFMVGAGFKASRRKVPSNEGSSDTDFTLAGGVLSQPIADRYAGTTVLFADLAGFTAWSSTRPADHVFLLLETLYKEFDRLALELGIFKVETIGDCYMAVCGVPDPRQDHAAAVAKFALAMQVVIVIEPFLLLECPLLQASCRMRPTN